MVAVMDSYDKLKIYCIMHLFMRSGVWLHFLFSKIYNKKIHLKATLMKLFYWSPAESIYCL